MAFADHSEVIASDLLTALQRLNEEHGLKFFDMTVRFSNKKPFQGLKCTNERFDQSFIKKEMEKWGKVSKVFVCGPPAMNRAVPEALLNLNFDKDLIHYV